MSKLYRKELVRGFFKMSVAGLWLLASPLAADTAMTTQNLLKACTTANADWISFCNGFLQAAADQAMVDDRACLPAGTTRTELVMIFEQEAKSLIKIDPTLGGVSGISVAVGIIEKAFPCSGFP